MYYEVLTEQIIGAFYRVHSKLGFGFLEKVYENALVIELKRANLDVVQQYPIDVYYDGVKVGIYCADIVVNDLVILELKACSSISEEHEAQLIHYLRSSEYEVGLILNFAKKATVKRKVFDNERKGS